MPLGGMSFMDLSVRLIDENVLNNVSFYINY